VKGSMNTGLETDERLVELAQAGNSAAFSMLVSRYRRKLLRFIEPLVMNASEGEDVVQEALLAAYRALHTFRGDSTFATWLYKIAINKAKNLRAQSFRRLPASRGEGEDLIDDPVSGMVVVETPETILERDELLNVVDSAIDQLPTEQREAFLLVELEGLSYEQIAALMRSPIGTVRSRVHRAREFIAVALRNANMV
jgi:RNA polymerase sigma-70 factor (ECF subfamily)